MKSENILILGGTQFIGRNLVAKLQELDQYEIYLFNRQVTGATLFPQIKKIKGDRQTEDIRKLAAIHWDYIIDCSCYYPDDLSKVLENINVDCKHYIFISTCSVYDSSEHLLARNENAAVLNCTAEEAIDSGNQSYGARKAECERILQASGIKYSILRPALVFGPYDHTDRFYYWLHQVRTEDRLIVPNFGGSLFSLSYVMDLVNVIIALLQTEASNTNYNVISKIQFSIAQLLQEAENILERSIIKINAPSKFLHEENISQWVDMPLWLDNDYFTYDNSSIKKHLNYQFTPIKDAIENTIQYYHRLGWPSPKYGMQQDIKDALIQKIIA